MMESLSLCFCAQHRQQNYSSPSYELTLRWECFFFLQGLSPYQAPFSPTELKIILFAFSYAMITSWQETSCQLEASYLWQLLSNCCSRMANPPLYPSAPYYVASITFWVAGESYMNFNLMSLMYCVFLNSLILCQKQRYPDSMLCTSLSLIVC